MNKVIFNGNVGKDSEFLTTKSGKSLLKFSVAIYEGKDKDATWVDCAAWEKTAEVFAKYVHKGDLIEVEANLKFETWTDRQTGEPRSKAVFQVERLGLLGRARGNNQNDDADYGEYDDDF